MLGNAPNGSGIKSISIILVAWPAAGIVTSCVDMTEGFRSLSENDIAL